MSLFLFLSLFLTSTFAAPCETASTIEMVRSAAKAGEVAFEDLELSDLLVERDKALAALRCLDGEIGPSDAVVVHWLVALSLFTTDRDQVPPVLQVIWQMDSEHEITNAIAPSSEHPLAKLYEQAKFAPAGDYEPVYPPVDGWAKVNGVRGADRPLSLPAIVQVFDGEGAVLETLYIFPGETMPAWGPSPLDLPPMVLRTPKPWWITSATTGAAALGCYAGAMSTKQTILDLDNPVPASDVPALQTRTNVLAGVAVGLGVLSFGTGATSLVTHLRTRGSE